jgi:allantoinase
VHLLQVFQLFIENRGCFLEYVVNNNQRQDFVLMRYPRDMHGHGRKPPPANWPGGAHIAIQFVVNYEEGGENCILHGDGASEAFLSEIVGAQPWPDKRHWNMESLYEYGARAGFWRLHTIFTAANIPVTVFGVATALARSPDQVEAMLDADWEIASHGLKWIEYRNFSKQEERAHMRDAVALHYEVTGKRPLGWYTGRCSVNTVDLATQEGGFAYVSDSYADDLPYWHNHKDKQQLIIPYTLDANDMRFTSPQGFNCGDQFYTYLKDSFDVLYAEGQAGTPKMLSIGLHCRLAGRPGRTATLKRFIDYVKTHDKVWLARRIDIAEHWIANHRASVQVLRPSTMNKQEFIDHFGGVFEHSTWIAEHAYDSELGAAHDTAAGIHSALVRIFRKASREQRLTVLKAHPDLAGRLAGAKRLTPDSTAEQASAGLDVLSDDEVARFIEINAIYTEKFGFPFIVAVKGRSKDDILENFETRVDNDHETEFNRSCQQVERIARLRCEEIISRSKNADH